MKRKQVFTQVLVFLLALVVVTGVALADDRSAPVVNTDDTWPFTHGVAGQNNSAVFGRFVGANDYDFAGQTVATGQRQPVLFSLVPSTGIVSTVTFNGGAATSLDVFAGLLPLANGNYAWFGRKVVSGSESRGSIFVRTNAGAHVGYDHTFGAATSFTRFNAALQVSGGTYADQLVVAGFSTATGEAGEGDVRLYRVNAPSGTGSGTSLASAFVGGANEEEAFAVAQLDETSFIVAGREHDGVDDYNFFVSKHLFSDLSEVEAFTFSGTTEDGDSDVIRDILIDGNGDIIIIGTTGDDGTTQGYVAKLDPTSGELVEGYEFVTTQTDVEFYKGDLMDDGHIVIVGRQGDDLFLIEIQDDESAFVVDWSRTYDSGADGDVGYWVAEQADNSILVAGAADDGNGSTNAVFWLFDQPQLAVYPNTVTYTSPADEAEDQDNNGVTLTWSDPGDDGGTYDEIVAWDVYLEDANPPTVKVVDGADVGEVTYETGALSGNTTYYWYVVGIDAEGDETAGEVWSFTTLLPPNTPTYVSPADEADDIQVAGATLTWSDPGDDGGTFDAIVGWDVFFEDANPPTVKVVDDVAVGTTTYETGGLDAETIYYWYVVARDADGHTSSGEVQSFTTVMPPEVPDLLTPADEAAEQPLGGVTLTWTAGEGDGDETVAFDVYFEAANPPTVKVIDDADESEYETGALDLATTYYWYVVARDADGDVNASAIRSFTSQLLPNTVYVKINSNVDGNDGNYYDNNNIAGFNELADDGYDSYDTPEPPALSANYIRTYLLEEGNSAPFDELTENYRALDDKDFETTTYLFIVETTTDQDGEVTFTVDVTTGNPDNYPVIWWDGTDFQNMLGADDADNTFSYTADGDPAPETSTFALLFGDTTPPDVTAVFPVPAGTSKIARNSSTATLEVSFDNSNPIRQVTVYFSPEDDEESPRDNFTPLTNNPMIYDGDINDAPDNPTDGITNSNLTLPWMPYVDDVGLFETANDVFPDAQLMFITEDWAGNLDTVFVDFEITPDEFPYEGDYLAGWHLISIPLHPDEALPTDFFISAEGDDAGIAGDFTMFEYSVAEGYEQPTNLQIAKGYWIILDEENSAGESNAGLGTVYGTVAGLDEDVDLELDVNAYNLVGISVRTEDLDGGGAIQAEEWRFSDDDFVSSYTWTEATTAADKGGDSNVWIDATSLRTYNTAGNDYTDTINDDDDLDPGVGYTLSVGTVTAGQLAMRTVRSEVEGDIANPDDGGEGRHLDDIDDFDGEWFIPIRTAIGDYFNDQSGFGCRPGASDGWDAGMDATNPPIPPSGHYVRAVVDGQSWNSPFGRYFVTDIRAPFDPTTTFASWTFKVYSSEQGVVTMTFDVSTLEEYNVPEGFTAVARVNDQTFDLLESQTIAFNYEGGMVPVVIEASLSTLGVGDEVSLPSVYSIAAAYPNPFNPSTVIRVGLPAASKMEVTVFNVLGEQVARLANGHYSAGYHNLVFDAANMASGVYFVRANVPGKLNQVRKVVLVR